MPEYYKASKVIDNLNNANALELDGFDTKLNNVLDQFFIDTSDFTLERWEKEFGIQVNNSYDIEFRRTRITSKLRGQGTITVNLIKNVSESFSNGEVDVIEDNPSYSFTVKFIGVRGIPPNLDDLKTAIENIKPAHLTVLYEFTYTLWEEVKNITWGAVKTSTWGQLKTREVI
jgi:uncharacterized protein YmfQ (DUF2313 family)